MRTKKQLNKVFNDLVEQMNKKFGKMPCMEVTRDFKEDCPILLGAAVIHRDILGKGLRSEHWQLIISRLAEDETKPMNEIVKNYSQPDADFDL